uniref:Uncharacterized protein n=1 Tax=Plectus sambesii TaxID=2011161 RepID=A0A914W9G8_9BILA
MSEKANRDLTRRVKEETGRRQATSVFIPRLGTRLGAYKVAQIGCFSTTARRAALSASPVRSPSTDWFERELAPGASAPRRSSAYRQSEQKQHTDRHLRCAAVAFNCLRPVISSAHPFEDATTTIRSACRKTGTVLLIGVERRRKKTF